MTKLKLFFSTCLYLIIIVALTSCGNFDESTSSPSSSQSAVIGVTTDNYPTSFIDGLIAQFNASANNALSGTTAKYAVNQYNLTYNTLDSNGNPTIASAKLLVPSYNQNVDIVLYLNYATKTLDSSAGTNTYVDFTNYDGIDTSTIATNIGSDTESLLNTILASQGIAVVMPDHLGFGASAGLHPYIVGTGYAYQSIDALRAAKNYADSSITTFTFSDKFIITGYSGGGYATLATHKELVTNPSNYTDLNLSTNLKGVVPGAPPANLSTVMAGQLLSVSDYPRPDYGPYILLGYNDTYNLVSDVKTLFKEEYQSVVDDFYSGTKSLSGDILPQFSSIISDNTLYPIDIFTDSFKLEITQAYADYNSDYNLGSPTTTGFFEKIIENDAYNYDPGTTNVFFLHLNADTIVPIENSESAAYSMQLYGNASSFNPSTGAGNIAIIDPVLYANPATSALSYTNGTFTDHSTGLVYYHLIMQGLAASWFAQ